MLSACGIDCSKCDIFKASTNVEIAKKISVWFRDYRHVDINYKDIRCDGCKGSADYHWSSDCWILNCCIHKKHLEDCSDCNEFACLKLKEWSYINEGYLKAFKKLEALNRSKKRKSDETEL
jgi:hypothetical protein